MNSSDLIKLIHEKTNLKLAKVKNVLDNFPNVIAEELNQDKEVKISNFGTFVIVTYPPRPVMNPRNSAIRSMTPPRRVAKFKPTKDYVKIIRGHKNIEENNNPDESFAKFNNLDQIQIPKKILLTLSEHFARHHKVAIIGKYDDKLVAFTTQTNFNNLKEIIKEKTGWDVILKNTNLTTLNHALTGYDEEIKIKENVSRIFKLKTIENELKPTQIIENTPIVRMIQSILKQAQYEEVRDIYLETGKDFFSIYFIKENIIKEIAQLPIEIYDDFYSHVKILSSMKLLKSSLYYVKWWLI